MVLHRATGFFLWLPLVIAALPAQAQTDASTSPETGDDVALAETRARAHFSSGSVLFEAEAYEDALEDFQLAYDESGRPELLYNIYLCYDRLGRLDEAFEALQRFGAAGAPGHDVALVQERLDELHAEIDARGPILEPAPVVAPPVDTTPIIAIAGFSVAGLGIVGFAIFGPLVLAEDAALGSECGRTCTPARAAMLDVYAAIADVSAGIALAGAIVGVIGLFVAPATAPAATPSARLSPFISRDGAGLTLEGRF